MRAALQLWEQTGPQRLVHGWEHPFSSPRLQFGRSFGRTAVSLSPSNLIGKPQACHSVLAAHIWTNTLRGKDTNLSVRWQRNDERGREALARGNVQCGRRHLSDVHLSRVRLARSSVRLQATPASGFRREQRRTKTWRRVTGGFFYEL